jgi:hypothetical protein
MKTGTWRLTTPGVWAFSAVDNCSCDGSRDMELTLVGGDDGLLLL